MTRMRLSSLYLLLVLLISANVCPSIAAKKPHIKTKSRFSEQESLPQETQNDQFDWELIKQTFMQDHRNVAVSTFSVKFLLHMLYEGTSMDSQTQREIAAALDRNTNEQEKCQQIMKVLQKDPEQLTIASRIFADRLINVVQKYESTIILNYNATVQNVNFQQPEEAAQEINRWAKEGTRGLIQKLVDAQNIQSSVMVLANTIYFKGLWANVFPVAATSVQPFTTANGKTVEVPFMKQIQDHYFAESQQLNAKLVRLPYTNGRFSMIVMLPNENSNLNDMISALSPDALHNAIRNMEETEVKVELPKFRIEYGSSLKEGLRKMGINRIFQDNAELGGIARGGPLTLKVSDVFQKTVFIVDEKGSTAGSASGSSLVFTIASEPEKFVANRPFLFFIEEESTGTILFAGKMENPQL